MIDKIFLHCRSASNNLEELWKHPYHGCYQNFWITFWIAFRITSYTTKEGCAPFFTSGSKDNETIYGTNSELMKLLQ